MNILPPLADDHPVVRDGTRCVVCEREFVAGERTSFMTRFGTTRDGTAEADLAHACCFYQLRLIWTPRGHARVLHIKDGDGSPFEIDARVLSGTKSECQFRIEECQDY